MGSVFAVRVRIFVMTLCLLGLGAVVGEMWIGTPLRQDIERQERDSVEARLRLIADQLALSGALLQPSQHWDSAVRKVALAAGAEVRLTLRSGQVLADSARAFVELSGTPESLPKEVKQALETGNGWALQESAETLWRAAVPWVHGGAVVGTVTVLVRPVATELTELTVWRGWIAAATGALGLALVIAFLATRFATEPARQLTRVAARMAGGELSARSDAQGTDEFAALGAALDRLATSLSSTLSELRAEKERLQRVLSSMTEGVLLVDAEGGVQLVNSALLEMLSIPPNPVGKPLAQVLENAQVVALLEDAPEGEHHTAELSLLHTPTRRIVASARRLPQGTGVLAVFVDMTEQRRLETVRQEFVSNASHELRTPIAAILSAVETLQTINAVTGEAERGFMDMIARNALRLKALVDDLLALSHLESGAVEVQLEPVRLRGCVESIMNDLAPSARKRGTELICLVRSDLVVLASQRGLQHVIGNLIDNAIKYCPPDSKVTVEAHPEDSVAVISVSDNGPGIPEAHRDRIFERFYRIDAGRSRALGGTGLGLSIVKHWVEAMGGTVRVISQKAGGTAFRVVLALSAEEQTPVSDAAVLS